MSEESTPIRMILSLSRLAPCLVLSLFLSCSPAQKGETLAKRHCSACHLFPDPSLLQKSIWETGVMPEMAFRMGLDVSKVPGTNDEELREIMKSIPLRPLVSEEEWRLIKAYYQTAAPDTLPGIDVSSITKLEDFTPTPVRLPITGQNMITLVKWDSLAKRLFVGTRRSTLYSLSPSLALQDSFRLSSPPSDMFFAADGHPVIACMGIMDPNDLAMGSVVQLKMDDGSTTILIDSIKRPVSVTVERLDKDADDDYLVCAFGNFTGSLNIYEQTGEDIFESSFVHNFPGTRKTVVRDMNNDGLKDILALVTQGDEQIALFTNRGNLRFSYQVLLKFPPVYGSSDFQLADFNGDGHPDILYTNGDNADHSYSLKPYHGVRIFQNNGRNSFSESLFFPMHGASMAKALDFDQDGDLDIAAISFFPDFDNHPEHGFIYLKNENGSFRPSAHPDARTARWITMEAADIDADGDVDLILGALDFPTSVPENLIRIWGEQKVSLLILRNNVKTLNP